MSDKAKYQIGAGILVVLGVVAGMIVVPSANAAFRQVYLNASDVAVLKKETSITHEQLSIILSDQKQLLQDVAKMSAHIANLEVVND